MDTGEFYKQTTLPHLMGPSIQEEPIPTKIGPYKIETLLSKGGMSLLYLGIHPESHKPLVVKVLSPHLTKNEDIIAQFLKEAEIIELSDHPNIVKLYGQGEWENGLYIAMEFVQGVSLKQFILQNSLSVKRVLEIILQVAYALLHLHTHGVVHRDLKPENILITEDGGVKVIDFGIAQIVQEESKLSKIVPGGLIGTPSYMSPEQKKDPAKTSYSSDIYALGIILYELLTGKLSYGKLQTSFLPKPLRAIVEKAVAKDPKMRYEEIVDFISDISTTLKADSKEPGIFTSDSHHLFETFEKLQKAFLPKSIPTWPDIDLGVAKSKSSLPSDLYYDFIKLTNGNYLVILAKSTTSSIDALVHLAILRGMVCSLVYSPTHSTSDELNLLDLVYTLNNMLCEDTIDLEFSFLSLYIDVSKNSFLSVNCGFHSIWRSSGSGSPHILTSDNPLLGKEANCDFYENVDNWNLGDVLLLHSFKEENKKQPALDAVLQNALAQTIDYSSKAQAEFILNSCLNAFHSEDDQSHIVISLESLT